MHRKGAMGFQLWRTARHNGARVWVRWWRIGDRLRPEIRPVSPFASTMPIGMNQ